MKHLPFTCNALIRKPALWGRVTTWLMVTGLVLLGTVPALLPQPLKGGALHLGLLLFGFALLLLALSLANREPAPRLASLTVNREAVRANGVVLVPGHKIDAAYLCPRAGCAPPVVHIRWNHGNALLELDPANAALAEKLLAALGYAPEQRKIGFVGMHKRWRSLPFLVVLGVIVGEHAGAWIRLDEPLRGAMMASVFVLALALQRAVNAWISIRLEIGSDGVLVHGRRRMFIPYARIQRIEVADQGELTLGLWSGASVHLIMDGCEGRRMSSRNAEAARARILEMMRRATSGVRHTDAPPLPPPGGGGYRRITISSGAVFRQ